jgi:hypothetical protein
LNVVLLAPGAVEGTVTDSRGAAVVGALVSAWGGFRSRGLAAPGGGDGGAGTRTDASGHYRLEVASGGAMRISARREADSPATARMVEVEEGATATADLVLADGGVVEGVVLDSASSPVPGAIVMAVDASAAPRRGFGAMTTADASGGFLLALLPGTHALSAWRPDVTMARGRGARPPTLATVQLAVGQHLTVSLALPDDPPANVTGVVLEPGGVPSPGATLQVAASGGPAPLAAAGNDGTFALAATAAAQVTVSARNGGRTGQVVVTPPATDVVVQLQPAAAVQGKLVGEPPPETFSLNATTSGAVPLPGGASSLELAGSTFAVQDLAAGQVVLHVTTDDGRLGAAQVSAGPGETKAVDVVLSPAATVTGRILDAGTGQPITRARIPWTVRCAAPPSAPTAASPGSSPPAITGSASRRPATPR